jgi:5-guanidino-2-oxopentanoate decarboxylase
MPHKRAGAGHDRRRNGMPSCGEQLMSLLVSYGVDTVFGIPGVHTLELYRGLATSGIRHIGVRHEQGAGFMADGYARISGRPGVCVLITGPGVTNAATAIAEAYADSSRVLVISSVNAVADLGMGRGHLHEIRSQEAVTAPLTGFSATALSLDEVPELVARAFAELYSGRPRPVHIALPIDLLGRPAGFSTMARPVLTPPAPSQDSVAHAAALMAGAKRPVMIVGGGAVDAAAETVALAERLGAAVIQTRAGKGIVPAAHDLNLGTTLTRPATRAVLKSADLVVAIGTELAPADHWVERLELGGKLIRIDVDPATLVRDYPAAAALLGDAGAAARMLLQILGPRPNTPVGFASGDELSRTRRDNIAILTPKQRKHAAILDVLRAALPEDGFVAADSTQLAYTGNAYFPCTRPRSWFFPVGYGTLGFALPAAIGAKLAAPERPGAVIVGDGGFLFTVQELATAVELRLPLAILLWNNDAYGQIRDDMVETGIPELGVRLQNPDFLTLARAFGCHAVRPDSLASLRAALDTAFAADLPTIIELREDAPYLP